MSAFEKIPEKKETPSNLIAGFVLFILTKFKNIRLRLDTDTVILEKGTWKKDSRDY